MEMYYEVFAIKDTLLWDVTRIVNGWTYPYFSEANRNRFRIPGWAEMSVHSLMPCKPVYLNDYWLGVFGFPRWKGSLEFLANKDNGLYTCLGWINDNGVGVIQGGHSELSHFWSGIPELALTPGDRIYLDIHGFNITDPWLSTIIKQPSTRGYRTLSLV